MTEVLNLATGEVLFYTLPPREAVVAAYLQATRDWNTWQYEEKRLPVYWGRWTVTCGDFTALKNKTAKKY